MRYAVVIERAEGDLSAYVPDLPGCVATCPDPEAALKAIREAIEMQLAGMVADEEAIPEPKAVVESAQAAV